MKKILWIVLILVVGVVGYLLFQKKETSEITSEIRNESVTEEGVVENRIANERYKEFTQEEFDKAVGKRRVLFFYASWCPICRPIDAEFKEKVEMIPEDVVVFRVNYKDPDTDESEASLAKKYLITYQHTFLILGTDGNILKMWSTGGMNKLLEMLSDTKK